MTLSVFFERILLYYFLPPFYTIPRKNPREEAKISTQLTLANTHGDLSHGEAVTRLVMASVEQPLKKRKIYELSPPPPPLQPPPPPPPPPLKPNDELPPPPPQPQTPPPLSHEEVIRRRRNHEEIRSVYENYKTIKRCISTSNDAHHMLEVEQAYLSLISASRGCTSVHRILSEFVPRYARYCPTALEAAAQVIINMHNCNLSVISWGEDKDGVSFETVKNCIIGLVDICCTAASEAPSSSVIRGICSAVFLNVITFFASSIEGNDIFQIVDEESLKMQDCTEIFFQLKECVLDEDASPFLKLLKLRALCFLRIFFLFPKDLLAACFELFNDHATDRFRREAKYILRQLSHTLNSDTESCVYGGNGKGDGHEASSRCMELEICSNDKNSGRQDSDYDHWKRKETGLMKFCLLGVALQQNNFLKKWVFSRYRRMQKLASSEAISQVTATFEGIFESFAELVKVQDNVEDSDEDASDSSNCVNGQYIGHRITDQRSPLCEVSVKDSSMQMHDNSCKHDLGNKVSGQYLRRQGSVLSLDSDHHLNYSCNTDSGSSKCISLDGKEQVNISHAWPSIPKGHLGDQLISPAMAQPSDFKIGPFEQGDKVVHVGIPTAKFPVGVSGSAGFGNNPTPYFPSASSQIVWYSDGDPDAMDVCSATKQLWLGSLAPNISEASLRFEFERFGPIVNFSFFPVKGFALVEYRSIIDASKAREFMRRYSPWGYPIRIKFIDIGLGTRGAVNGVGIGYSSHVYVGNVWNQWMKNEIMQETMKTTSRGPRLVADLTSECALLLEFENPEEAANAMTCIRQFCRGIKNAGALSTEMSGTHSNYCNVARAPLSSVLGNTCNSLLGSPHSQTVGSPANRNSCTAGPSKMKPEGIPPEFVSPKAVFEQGISMQGGQVAQSNIPSTGCTVMLGIGMIKSSMTTPSERIWKYWTPELEKHSAAGAVTCSSVPTLGPPVAPSQPIQHLQCMGPVYPPSTTNSWDGHGLSHHIPRPMPCMQSSTIPPPFVQASVTPLSQLPASGIPPYSQVVLQPTVHPSLPSIPLAQPDLPPPLPPSPPMVPPPPSSPPPSPTADSLQPFIESVNKSSVRGSPQTQWQGILAKSGVHYCNVRAYRLESTCCNYSISIAEPACWPVKLDMTKRTDFRHVRAAFTNTPPSKRELCELVPSSGVDHMGFQDFIAYLKQRECAGVIKIPTSKTVWARLLFILPYSPEACSMLCLKPKASGCLIALVLPKEANSEGP